MSKSKKQSRSIVVYNISQHPQFRFIQTDAPNNYQLGFQVITTSLPSGIYGQPPKNLSVYDSETDDSIICYIGIKYNDILIDWVLNGTRMENGTYKYEDLNDNVVRYKYSILAPMLFGLFEYVRKYNPDFAPSVINSSLSKYNIDILTQYEKYGMKQAQALNPPEPPKINYNINPPPRQPDYNTPKDKFNFVIVENCKEKKCYSIDILVGTDKISSLLETEERKKIGEHIATLNLTPDRLLFKWELKFVEKSLIDSAKKYMEYTKKNYNRILKKAYKYIKQNAVKYKDDFSQTARKIMM